MNNAQALHHIDELKLTPPEIRDLINTLISRERAKARTDAYTYAELLSATLVVADFNDPEIPILIEALKNRILGV